MFLKKYFSLLVTVINLREQFFQSTEFLYFTKVVAANHSSMDTLFFRRTFATIYITCIWQIFLFTAYFYFKGTLAGIHLSGTIIILGGHLQWSSIFKGAVFFFCNQPIKYSVSGINLNKDKYWRKNSRNITVCSCCRTHLTLLISRLCRSAHPSFISRCLLKNEPITLCCTNFYFHWTVCR